MDSGGANHYAVLGLVGVPSQISKDEITRAYKLKARELHPDKRPDDPNAAAMFIQLHNSYELLKDDKTRRLFDEDLLRLSKRETVLKRETEHPQGQQDPKRRKMMSELKERERAAFSVAKAQEEEDDRTFGQLQEGIARVVAGDNLKKKPPPSKKDDSGSNNDKVLKVLWEEIGEDYTAQRLREIFGKFGHVENVVLCKKKGSSSALVEMASKDAAVSAARNVLSDCSNRLRVEHLQPASSPPPVKNKPKLSAADFRDFENSVLEKMMKLANFQR